MLLGRFQGFHPPYDVPAGLFPAQELGRMRKISVVRLHSGMHRLTCLLARVWGALNDKRTSSRLNACCKQHGLPVHLAFSS